jgi:FKBP-type peptidyl-prolyl cis-trans isomerase 2
MKPPPAGIQLRLFLLLLLLSGCLSPVPRVSPGEAQRVEAGDLVTIRYTGRVLETGAVFETTDPEVASDPNLRKVEGLEVRPTGPVKVLVGMGDFPFEEALLGLAVGEETTVVLPPEEGYGPWDERRVRVVDRTTAIPRRTSMPVRAFREVFGEEPLPNGTYPAGELTVRVVERKDGRVSLLYDPPRNRTRRVPNGVIVIRANRTDLLYEFEPLVGVTVRTPKGEFVTVLRYNGTSMVVDSNHPLAGKSLLYTLRVEAIEKGEGGAENL